MVICLSQSNFQLKLGARRRTNARDKFLSLWGLIYFSNWKNFKKLQVERDSKVVVEWFNGRVQMHIQLLEPWQQKIRHLQETFQELNVSHVHREFNGRSICFY